MVKLTIDCCDRGDTGDAVVNGSADHTEDKAISCFRQVIRVDAFRTSDKPVLVVSDLVAAVWCDDMVLAMPTSHQRH